MSTNGMTSWAVDLAEVGAIYPFQGTEVLLTIVGIIFWIGFHILQSRVEAAELKEAEAEYDVKIVEQAIDRY